jgi:hypothetical protein
MAFVRRRVEGLTTATPVTIGTVGGGVKAGTGAYARLWRIIARNFASSLKAAAGADVLGRIEVDDAEGKVLYLDAADRDYATAEVRLDVHTDVTATGLTGSTDVDRTGAAFTLNADATFMVPVIAKLPFTVKGINFGTVTDFLSVDLILEV